MDCFDSELTSYEKNQIVNNYRNIRCYKILAYYKENQVKVKFTLLLGDVV